MQLFFQEGGVVMFPTAVFGALLVAASVLALRGGGRAELRVVLGALTLASGALGTVMGLINTMRWVTKASVTDQLVGGATGIAESLNNLVLAFLLIVMALLVSAVSALRSSAPPAAAR
jgi:hypothetical protein